MAEEKKKSKKVSFKEEMKNVKKVKPKMRGRTLFSPAKKYGEYLRKLKADNAPKS